MRAIPAIRTTPVMHGNEPAVIQPDINGCQISWNPDDARWYIERDGDTVGVYKDRRNALQKARTFS